MHPVVAQAALIESIRTFFSAKDYLSVEVPPIVAHPGMEPHIHPFSVGSIYSGGRGHAGYLQSSPEFSMKHLLSLNTPAFSKIFTIGFSFRDEPDSPVHRAQFLLLEWYRIGASYLDIMEETKQLIRRCQRDLRSKGIETIELGTDPVIMSVEQAFKKWTTINPFENSRDELAEALRQNYPEIPANYEQMDWDDLYFSLFLNVIEPELEKIPEVYLYNFPSSQAALSKVCPEDPRFCQRFELYLFGVEICNCFSELTDWREQLQRAKDDDEQKQRLYDYGLGVPNDLIDDLKKGLPDCAGNALGVERLLKSLTKIENPFFALN